MNLQFYIEKLKTFKEFKDFKKKYSDSYLCSGFFILDRENLKNPENKSQLDFYSSEEKKMFSFQLDEGVKMAPLSIQEGFTPLGKLLANSTLDFLDIEMLISERMEKENIKNKIQKIIIVLQNKCGKDIWICTAFISGLGLIRADIEDSERKIILFEKKSFFDMMRFVKGKEDKK